MRAVNFRPKVDPDILKKIAKKQAYRDLSGFINDAIEEKLQRMHENPRDHKLMAAVKKALYEYNGWVFSKPSPGEAAKISARAKSMRSGKTKSVPLADILKKLS